MERSRIVGRWKWGIDDGLETERLEVVMVILINGVEKEVPVVTIYDKDLLESTFWNIELLYKMAPEIEEIDHTLVN